MISLRTRRHGSNAALCCAVLVSSPAVVLSQAPAVRRSYAVPVSITELARSTSPVRFGGSDLELSEVVTIVPRRDGGVVVADGGARKLLYFDRDGHLVRTVGGPGGGPGEYQELGGIAALPGDSLIAWDGILRRATVLTPTGAYVRAFPLEAPFAGGGSVTRLLALRTGEVIVGYSEVTSLAPSLVAKEFGERLMQYRSDGTRGAASEVKLLSSEHFVQTVPREMGGVAYWGLAFGRQLTVRASSRGIATGDGSEWSVSFRQMPGGEVREQRSLARERVPVTPADIAAYRARALRGEAGASRVIAERMVDEMPFPKQQPAFVRFEVDERDQVWIEDYQERRNTSVLWYRLGAAATQVRAVRFPPRFKPLAFTAAMVYGVWRDDDDVELLQAYRLTLG